MRDRQWERERKIGGRGWRAGGGFGDSRHLVRPVIFLCISARLVLAQHFLCEMKGVHIICKLEHLWDICRHIYTHSNTHLGGMVVDEISSDPRIISPVEVRPVNVVFKGPILRRLL